MSNLSIKPFLTIGSTGNIAVEFALIAPVAMLMLVGIAEYGTAVYDRLQLSSALRAGIQYATVAGVSTDAVEQVVTDALTSDPAAVTVTAQKVCECPDGTETACDQTCSDGTRRTFMRIDAVRQREALFSYPGISAPTTLVAHAFVRTE
jgi:Flp pilus assembly protein TadG